MIGEWGMSLSTTSSGTINGMGLAVGVYMVQIIEGDQVYSYKVVVQ
jgi:seryl-tRNA synthetase